MRFVQPPHKQQVGDLLDHLERIGDWPGLGNGPAGLVGQGARPRRQRSHVRIVSGAPNKRMYVHGGSVEAMKAAIELLTFDGFALT